MIYVFFGCIIGAFIYVHNNWQNSANNSKILIICPHCNRCITIPSEGQYYCPICDNGVSYGNYSGVGVFCPHCKKVVFVSGEGEHNCPKCNMNFKFSKTQHDSTEHQTSHDKYYEVLGCNRDASLDDVRKKYKELVFKFHPDRVASKDLPEEFIQFSTQKFKEVHDAYEKIKSIRN